MRTLIFLLFCATPALASQWQCPVSNIYNEGQAKQVCKDCTYTSNGKTLRCDWDGSWGDYNDGDSWCGCSNNY